MEPRPGATPDLCSLLAGSSEVILVGDPDAGLTYQSPSTADVLGYGDDALVGRPCTDLVHPHDVDRVREAVARLLASPPTPVQVACRLRHRDGRWIDVEAHVRNRLGEPGARGLVAYVHDVTDRRVLERKLQQQALVDALTGLPNRSLFRDRVEHAVSRVRRRGGACAVLFVDLDGFKTVNDALGHQAGDELLRTVAQRLANTIREHDTVARLGGDEFAVLVEELPEETHVARVADRILEALRVPVQLEGRTVTIEGSIGIAISGQATPGSEDPVDDETEALLRNADVAMYLAKAGGRGRYELFEPALHVAVLERLRLEADLRQALDEDQFVLHYQPIVSLDDRSIVGVEALLRWQHPERGLVSPGQFIPATETTGLIVPIGAWVLREACKQIRRWQRENPGQADLHVSVNVSPTQLTQGDVAKDVRIALAVSGLAPEHLTLELTESAVLPDVGRAQKIFRELKAIGVRLAVDDFGTGYSSLASLRDFPFDVLKIDRSFATGGARTDGPTFVRAIVDLGRSLRLTTVAEGIEHDDELGQLRELRCDLGQGYLFARPDTADRISPLLKSRPASTEVGWHSGAGALDRVT